MTFNESVVNTVTYHGVIEPSGEIDFVRSINPGWDGYPFNMFAVFALPKADIIFPPFFREFHRSTAIGAGSDSHHAGVFEIGAGDMAKPVENGFIQIANVEPFAAFFAL
ncbi:MAG TPA: hypothetical protein VFV23_13065 [Verrucomicrobiae bacterium]|nr:hypothetical protein [Verrucomicrobiae bacterium]